MPRPDLYFAVTVPPRFRDGREAKVILRRYRSELVFLSVLAMGVFLAGATRIGVGSVSVGLLIQIVAGFIAFYRTRQQTLPHAVPPTMVREAELHQHEKMILGGWIAAGTSGLAGQKHPHFSQAFGTPTANRSSSEVTLYLFI